MEHNEKSNEKVAKMSEKELLAYVSEKLKDRVLFPKRHELAKAYLQKVKSFKW
ncbi:hypothetical protein MKQ68_04250 [Chitinophaga horti]|uniref:Uncharacterized protein n=1 Tax=Chitinophaga horti TaxID=2920382 RepID=A0ABY6J3V3_9BACT|nr:hypothetical protein [Chitinophaga horti]UYQ94302.1 hypothetical protein MKQ68_04250 [Chitinophaga horti]